MTGPRSSKIRKQIKAGKTGPLYLLEGDDPQSRHDLAIEFANVVDEGLQAFNVQSFYANEAGNAAGRDQLIGVAAVERPDAADDGVAAGDRRP